MSRIHIPAGFDPKKIQDYLEKEQAKTSSTGRDPNAASFSDVLQESLADVDRMQKDSDQKTIEVATGKDPNLHEAMIAMTKAELSFNLMVQVRNRALEAYQEVMRMPV